MEEIHLLSCRWWQLQDNLAWHRSINGHGIEIPPTLIM